MEIALLIIAIIVVVVVVLVARSSRADSGSKRRLRRRARPAGRGALRAGGDAAEAEMRAMAPGADVSKQFKRPPNEGGLL
jgi:hypothetical protein